MEAILNRSGQDADSTLQSNPETLTTGEFVPTEEWIEKRTKEPDWPERKTTTHGVSGMKVVSA